MEQQSSGQSSVNISAEQFYKRYRKMVGVWEQKYSDQYDAIAILYGIDHEDAITIKISALHIWYLGYEFVDSLIILTKKSCIVIASPKKFQYINHFKNKLEDKPINLKFFEKKQSNNYQVIQEAFDLIKEECQSLSPLKIGLIQKEKQFGTLVKEFEDQVKEVQGSTVDMGGFIQDCLSCKDSEEIEFIKVAGKISSYFEQKLIEEIEHLIDEELDQTHGQISDKIDKLLQSENEKKILEKKFGADKQYIDFSYNPVIQSGGIYDLRPQAESDSNKLSYDVIICSVGIKYHEYNANTVRTLFIDPNSTQKQAYLALLEAQNTIISAIKVGTPLNQIYQKAKQVLQDKYSEFANNLGSNCGYGIGLEFRESNLFINESNTTEVAEGMVFNVAVSMSGLLNGKKEEYSQMIADTVVVKANGQEVITSSISKKYEDISYQLQDEDNNDQSEKSQQNNRQSRAAKQQPQTKDNKRTRGKGQSMINDDIIQKRKEHQQQLIKLKQEELEARLASGSFKGASKSVQTLKLDKLQSYQNVNAVPQKKNNQIFVDMQKDSVLLPINGVLVPFHISVIKNVSKHEEGNQATLRFNFHVPGTSSNLANIVFPDINQAPIYIRELTYRSKNIKQVGENLKKIKDLQKKVKTSAQENHDKDVLAELEPIQLIKGKRPTLQDLKLRPNISGRKTHGTLEAHLNGFRYQSSKNERIDLNYKNIKHAFFQGCEREMIVLIHFNLFQPIMIGKKKCFDIQFYTEAGVQTEDLDFRRRANNDLDEYEQEERERALRKRLDREFEMFVKAVESIAKDQISFQSPYRELGFYGTPGRSLVYIMPTVHCLVNLSESPFYVCTIDEIECANFERIKFGLTNFDLTIVFKDYDKPVSQISAIPIEFKEPLITWLDKMDILYFETQTNLNWTNVMNQIKSSLDDFVIDGGWAFLQQEEDEESVEEEIDDDSEFDASEIEEEDDDSDESDFSGDEEGGDGSEDDFSGEDEDSEGLEWDELDEIAEKKDQEKKKSRK